ncbi:MAG: glutathione S-transferase family protein [Gammaproteobacteria bacterium]|nr:glutathione S-transferase family protein [Gammaproteobacteria bacterium]NND38420.1 glutathione S-transferase family protein [Pseudomonadales bacterium]NNM12103.1 glutathione S-transferase family protein [Pseudomonadales bacterium]RZV51277.1 MAG: glutathione S-transferase family protein [Pseudomonadales bacterium]
MIILHGFAYSNYYNIVKHVLLHKGVPFKEDLQWGGSDDYLQLSPAGKIPSMTLDGGEHLSESSVCCDYLEDAYPDPALYPADALARARVRQIMKIAELYLELSCRRLLPFAFTQSEVPAPIAGEVREVVSRGIAALNQLCEFSPFVTGSQQSMADIYLRYVMGVTDLGGTLLKWDIGNEIEGLRDWQAMMAELDISKKIDADRQANEKDFFAMVQQRIAAR